MRATLHHSTSFVLAALLAAACADPVRVVATDDAPPAPPMVAADLASGTSDGAPTTPGVITTLYSRDKVTQEMLRAQYYDFARADRTDEKARCGPARSILGRITDDLAKGVVLAEDVGPAALAAAFAELGGGCPSTQFPIAGLVSSATATTLQSADELLSLSFRAGTFTGDALVVVERLLPAEPIVLGTTLRQFGPFYRVSAYPAVAQIGAFGVEAYLVGPIKVGSSAQQWVGLGGQTGGGTTSVLRPEFCYLLSGRVGAWGSASFLQPVRSATYVPSASGADLRIGDFTTMFVNDSASTSGSGCGQTPPPSSDGFELRGETARGEPGVAFFDAAAPTTVVGTFGAVQMYDPAQSALARASLSAKVCARQATVTNTADVDFVAVIDPVNRATGRWSGWKEAVLVPAGKSRTVTLPIPDDYKSDEVQLSYGPESLGHVGLSSGC